MESPEELISLLQECTVRLSITGTSGTGFFVAPSLILTCAHVVGNVQNDGISVTVEWKDLNDTAKILHLLPAPYPDLALLKLENTLSTHPCVFLHEAVRTGDNLYSYGYPKGYSGDPSTFVVVGMSNLPKLIKFKLGQVKEGFSGAPILNQRTGGVCGVMKLTLGENALLGGRAIPTSIVLDRFPELVVLQNAFHQKDSRWHNCCSPQQYHEQVDAFKRTMMKVIELKSVHSMLHEIEAALAPISKELSLFKNKKLRRIDIDDIESQLGEVWRRIKELQDFAEHKMTYLLEEEERFTISNDTINGPRWITDLINLQYAFKAGLKGRNSKEMADVSDDLLSRCRTHLHKIDDRLHIAVNQLDRLSDQN